MQTKVVTFGLQGTPERITVLNWYKEKLCLSCGANFFTLIDQQGFCSDKCKWNPYIPNVLTPIKIQQEMKRQPASKSLVGCEHCTKTYCDHHGTYLVSTDKRGKTYTRDYAVQSELPYGCNSAWEYRRNRWNP